MPDYLAGVTAHGVCWSTNQSPAKNDSKTMDGGGIGSFTSSITPLTPNTLYYVKAYATNTICRDLPLPIFLNLLIF